MINVWITEQDKNTEPYCLVERADNRDEAIENLNEALLTDGVVPSWVKSVDFYEQGDFPTETYTPGDAIRIDQ